MNCSTPGLPVHHQLPEFTQTHVHRVSDAIQPSHPLLSPSPPAPNPSQHQSFPMSQLLGLLLYKKSISNLTDETNRTVRSDLSNLLKSFVSMFIRYQSVQFSRSVVSNSLRPRESQHARPPCPSPTPRVHSDSRPSSQ